MFPFSLSLSLRLSLSWFISLPLKFLVRRLKKIKKYVSLAFFLSPTQKIYIINKTIRKKKKHENEYGERGTDRRVEVEKEINTKKIIKKRGKGWSIHHPSREEGEAEYILKYLEIYQFKKMLK